MVLLLDKYLSHMGQADNTAVPIWNSWRDKAGGYGIQDPFGKLAVKRINGDYYNVVGLPISRLYRMLKELELPVDDNFFLVNLDVID
jgi:septum formation protein